MKDSSAGLVKLIYSCSGLADVGDLADRVARKLSKDGFGRMACLSCIGAGIPESLKSAKEAPEIITIDGCPSQCAKKILKRIGCKTTACVLSNVGFIKGKSPVTSEAINSIVKLIKSKVPPRTNTPEDESCCSE